jgi:hypothetical protein
MLYLLELFKPFLVCFWSQPSNISFLYVIHSYPFFHQRVNNHISVGYVVCYRNLSS